jgi:hypothetical protein
LGAAAFFVRLISPSTAHFTQHGLTLPEVNFIHHLHLKNTTTMKKITLLIAAGLLTKVQADLVIKQSMEGPMKGETTLTIKGDKMRTDVGKELSSIMDMSTGDMETFMHTQKMTMKIKGSQTKAGTEVVKKEMEKTGENPLKATGKKEKVGEHDCEIYEMNIAGSKTQMWIAKDYPNYDKIKKEMDVMQQAASKMSGVDQQAMELPGMAVKTVVEAAGMKTTTTLVSVETKAVDDSVFKAPAGYTELPTQ